jgi:hypothetical protein
LQKPILKPQTASNAGVERNMVARKNSLERPEPRKKPREELFWLCQVEIITEHSQDVQMFIDDQQGQIIIITVVVEGARVGFSLPIIERISTAPAEI